MADLHDDHANMMSSSACNQVSTKEYEDDISCETDKALGDLCMYLDEHPEVYARILRKKKQDEMETSGPFSFVKLNERITFTRILLEESIMRDDNAKMLKLVQGDEFHESLMSSDECAQQATSLKAGLCKTFQYAQETKGAEDRYSQRLATKRDALIKKQAEKSISESSGTVASGNYDVGETLEKSDGKPILEAPGS